MWRCAWKSRSGAQAHWALHGSSSVQSALGYGRLPDQSLGWAAPARVPLHSVTPGSLGELVLGAAGSGSELEAQLEFDSGAARGPAPRFPVPPRQPPALRQLQTSRAGGELWQLCASVPLQGRSGALGLRPCPELAGCLASHSWCVLGHTATLAVGLLRGGRWGCLS